MCSIRTARKDANQELHPDDQDPGDAEDLLDATADAVDDGEEDDDDQAAEQVEAVTEGINKKRESWQHLTWYFSQTESESFLSRIFWWNYFLSPGRERYTTAFSRSLSCWL